VFPAIFSEKYGFRIRRVSRMVQSCQRPERKKPGKVSNLKDSGHKKPRPVEDFKSGGGACHGKG
jgi:hypothetical protein